MKWSLGSTLKERKDAVRIGRMAETWCKNNMGENNKKKFAILVTYWKGWDTDMGQYDPEDHAIFIYYNNTNKVKDLLQTIIHEWTHSLQPLTSKWKEYNAVAYSKNPYEKEAYASEKLYSKMWVDIKHKLNK
jgi:hypothetical protein